MSLSPDQTAVARFAAGLYNIQLGRLTLAAVDQQLDRAAIRNDKYLDAVLNSYYTISFGGRTSASVAADVVKNVGIVAGTNGLTAADVATAVQVVTAALNTASVPSGTPPVVTQGAAINKVLADFSRDFTTNAVFGPAAVAFNAKVAQATAYAATGTVDVAFGSGSTNFATAGLDTLSGTAGNDTFTAGQGTLGSNDVIDGGAGLDTLKASITGIIAPTISGVEVLEFQAQFRSTDAVGDNNLNDEQIVKVDFNTNVSSITGFTTIANSNSRSDLIIEDVRISDTQKTEDITIVMRETDPGNVDYGVYFDQNSLRNVSSSASQINLRVLDTNNTNLGGDPIHRT